MCNTDIRETAKQAGVFLYAVADKLGISEPTMTRLLRKELPSDKKAEIKKIIADLALKKQEK
ncbi:MAG TPA: hypothetical protein DDX91_04735 [Ruminococcaceae bacterium]|nr:hypothetical protein [Oscillospiraceae bacterium]